MRALDVVYAVGRYADTIIVIAVSAAAALAVIAVRNALHNRRVRKAERARKARLARRVELDRDARRREIASLETLTGHHFPFNERPYTPRERRDNRAPHRLGGGG